MPFEKMVLINRNREGKLEKYEVEGKELKFIVKNRLEWAMLYGYLNSVTEPVEIEES